MLIRKSLKLNEKANCISKLIGSGEQLQKQKMVNKLYSLKECSARVLRSNQRIVSKNKLNNVYAAFMFETERKMWIDNGPFDESTYIENIGYTSWFSVPEYNESRQKYEPKCLDAYHLLVNSRAKAWQIYLKKRRGILLQSKIVTFSIRH
jgi:hypothetical protein